VLDPQATAAVLRAAARHPVHFPGALERLAAPLARHCVLGTDGPAPRALLEPPHLNSTAPTPDPASEGFNGQAPSPSRRRARVAGASARCRGRAAHWLGCGVTRRGVAQEASIAANSLARLGCEDAAGARLLARHAGALAARDALDAQALALLANAFSRMPLGSARAEAAALRPLFLAALRAPTGAFAAQHASSLLNAAAAARVRDPALASHLALALEAHIDAACGFLPRRRPPAGGAPGARVSPQSVALAFHALAVLDLGDQAPPRPAPPRPAPSRFTRNAVHSGTADSPWGATEVGRRRSALRPRTAQPPGRGLSRGPARRLSGRRAAGAAGLPSLGPRALPLRDAARGVLLPSGCDRRVVGRRSAA